MKSSLKILAGIALVVLLVFAVGSILIRLFLPPEKVKSIVLKQLTGRLSREVSIGDVSVGLLSGLSVRDLKISERPTFQQGTFLSSDEFSIHLSLPPLLARKVVLRRIALKRPNVTVIREADGQTFNFSDLLSPSSAPAQSPLVEERADAPAAAREPSPAEPSLAAKSPEAPFLLLVSRAEISQGTLRFLDRSPANQSMELNDLDVAVKNVRMSEPFTLQASAQAKARGTTLHVKFAGDVDLSNDSAVIKQASVTGAGTNVTAKGQIAGMKSKDARIDAEVDAKELNPAAFKAWVALPPALTMSGPGSARLQAKGTLDRMTIHLSADLSRPQVHYAPFFQKAEKVPFTLSLSGDVTQRDAVAVRDLQMALAGARLNGHGTIAGLTAAAPTVQMHVESNNIPVSDVAQTLPGLLPTGVTLGGAAQIVADVSGTTASSRIAAKLNGKDLTVHKAGQFEKAAGVPLELAMIGDWLAPVGTDESTLALPTLSLTAGPIHAQGNATYRAKGKAGSIAAAFKTNSWSLQEAARLSPLAAAYKPAGQASLQVQASGAASAPSVSGTLSLQNAVLHYERSQLDQLQGAVQFTLTDATIPKLTGRLNGSDFSMKVVGKALTTRPDLFVEGTFSALDLDKLLPAIATAPVARRWELIPLAYAAPAPASAGFSAARLAGHVTVGKIKHEVYQAQNMDLTWNLTDVTPDLSRVSGTANLQQAAGRVSNAEKLSNVSHLAKVMLLPVVTLQKLQKAGWFKELKIPSLDSLPFDSLKGDYALKAGGMDIKTFELLGKDLSLITKGSVGLAGLQAVNLKVSSKLPVGAIGGTLGSIIQDESGRPVINFSVTGTMNDPKVRPDLEDVGRKFFQRLGDQFLKGPSTNQKPSGESGEPAPAEASQAEPSKKPANDLEKALKNIFGK